MRALVLLVPLLLSLPAAGAEECALTTSTTDGSQVVVDTTTNDAVVHYLAIDLCQPDCFFSIWPYREYNGVPGLQRADEMRDDTCGGLYEGDGFEF